MQWAQTTCYALGSTYCSWIFCHCNFVVGSRVLMSTCIQHFCLTKQNLCRYVIAPSPGLHPSQDCIPAGWSSMRLATIKFPPIYVLQWISAIRILWNKDTSISIMGSKSHYNTVLINPWNEDMDTLCGSTVQPVKSGMVGCNYRTMPVVHTCVTSYPIYSHTKQTSYVDISQENTH